MIRIEKILDANTQQIVWDIRHEVFVIGQNCPKEIEYAGTRAQKAPLLMLFRNLSS